MGLPTGVLFSVGNQDLTHEPNLGLVTSTETPGGFDKATFSLACSSSIVTNLKLADKVSVFDSTYNKYPFIGRILDIHKSSDKLDITATRSTRDTLFRKITVPTSPTVPTGVTSRKVYTAGTPYLQVLQDGVSLCPDVGDGGIVNPGLQFVADSNDFGGQNAEQLWNAISALTNALATPLMWWVRGEAGLQVVVIQFVDLAPRYFAQIPEAQIDETYSAEAIANRATVAYGQSQVVSLPEDNGSPMDYHALQIIRDRYANGTNTVTRREDALALAGNYLSRFNTFRSVNDSIVIKCNQDTVRVVPPVVTTPNDNWPLWLIESGHGLHLLNRPSGQAPYNVSDKFITRTEYNWDNGELHLSCGDLSGFDSEIQNIVDYNVNRLFNGPASGAPPRWPNHPLVDNDLLTRFGPPINASDSPPNVQAGIPMFVRDDNGELKYDKVIHPDLIADEGIEINYSFDITTTGWKGGPWSIPGELTGVKYSLWKSDATNGLQKDSCKFEIYTRKVGTAPSLLQSVIISNKDEGDDPVDPTKPLPDRDTQIVLKVITAASQAEIINVTLHGKKLYPGLKV